MFSVRVGPINALLFFKFFFKFNYVYLVSFNVTRSVDDAAVAVATTTATCES